MIHFGENESSFFGICGFFEGVFRGYLMETDSFEMIDDILDGILHSSSNPFMESQIFEMLSLLEQMSENELRSMPPQLHGILFEMIGKGIFSSALEKKLIRVFEL